MPDANRLHRGSKLAGRVAVYTHRDPRQVMAQFAGEKIHRAAEIPIRTFDRGIIEELAAILDRRTSLSISVSQGELYISIAERNLTLPIVEYRISS